MEILASNSRFLFLHFSLILSLCLFCFSFHFYFLFFNILGDKLSKNFDIEEAKLKFIMEEKKNEESENDKTKNENLRLSNLRKSNIFKSNNDDDIILCLPSVFHEKKYHLKHYNARNRNTINDNTNNLSNNNNLLNNNTNNNTLISHNFSPSKSKPNFEVETKNNRLSINETMTIPRGIQHREAMGQTINEPSPTVRWLVKKTDSPNQDLIVSESYQHHFL